MAQTPPRKIAAKKKEVTSPLSSGERIAKANTEYSKIAESPYFRDTLGVKQSVFPNYMGENGTYGYYDSSMNSIFFNPDQPFAGDRTPRKVLTHEGAHALTSKGYEQFPSYAAVNRPTFETPFDESFSTSDGKPPAIVNRETPDDKKAGRDATTFDRNKNTVTEPGPPRWYKPRGYMKERPMLPSEAKAMGALDEYYAFAKPVEHIYTGEQSVISNPREAFAQAYTNAAGFLSETANDTTDFRNKIGRYEGNTPGAGAIVLDLLKGNPIYKNHPLKSIIR